jgi:hypothetical protein
MLTLYFTVMISGYRKVSKINSIAPPHNGPSVEHKYVHTSSQMTYKLNLTATAVFTHLRASSASRFNLFYPQRANTPCHIDACFQPENHWVESHEILRECYVTVLLHFSLLSFTTDKKNEVCSAANAVVSISPRNCPNTWLTNATLSTVPPEATQSRILQLRITDKTKRANLWGGNYNSST